MATGLLPLATLSMLAPTMELQAAATFSNSGAIYGSGGATYSFADSSAFINAASVSSDGSDTLTFDESSSLTNTGVISNGSGPQGNIYAAYDQVFGSGEIDYTINYI